jgi:hypothetical protein
MKLTGAQLAHFEAFGFLVFRQLLSPAEIATYSAEFDAGFADAQRADEARTAGQPRPEKRTYAGMMGEATPFMARLDALGTAVPPPTWSIS